MTKVRLLLAALLLVGLTPAAALAAYDAPPEDYASYEPQKVCRATARPGTKALATWIDRRFAGGRALPSVRSCRSGGTSEHKDGRAIDWMMDARRKAHRAEVARFLRALLATDADGNEHALARRMGVMYVIWNDRMYASYRHFEPTPYRSSSCKRLRTCSATLRHRNHVHVSLGVRGARGLTSWYGERAGGS